MTVVDGSQKMALISHSFLVVKSFNVILHLISPRDEVSFPARVSVRPCDLLWKRGCNRKQCSANSKSMPRETLCTSVFSVGTLPPLRKQTQNGLLHSEGPYGSVRHQGCEREGEQTHLPNLKILDTRGRPAETT